MLHPMLAEVTPRIFGTNTVSGDVGIELEIEGDHLPRQVTNWSRKPEGSLRGRDGRTVNPDENEVDTPQEYISRGPILLGSLRGNLNTLCNRLTTQPTVVRLTPRASTHIHLNMTMDTFQTVLFYVILFTMYEPVILRHCGPQRNGNLFCLPSYETGELPNWVARAADVAQNWPNTDFVRHYWPKRGKYAALNTDPLMTLGSLETRCFPNSINPDEIYGWAEWLVKIREIARGLTFETMGPFIDRAYSEPMWFLSQVFPLNNIYSVCQPTHPSELVAYGVEQGFEVWKAVQQFGNYEEKKRKPVRKKGLEEFNIPTPADFSIPSDDFFEDDV